MTTPTSTKAVDVVGVYDVDFNQVFPEARPLKATVTDKATFFKHPLENSSQRTDHIIFMPVSISMTIIMSGEDYKSVYQQVKQTYRDQIQLIVQTKTDTYENIYIQGMPHEESPENFDSVIMGLLLEETQIANTKIIFLPSSMSDRNTKNRGQQEPKNPNAAQEKKGSTLARWFS